jgi:hypothetical protein
MRFRSIKFMWIVTATFLLLIGYGLFARQSKNDASEFPKACLKESQAPSPAALRFRAIRNYLKLELESYNERRENGAEIRLLLIRGDVSRESLRQMVLDRRLHTLLDATYKKLDTPEQIDALTDEELAQDLVFANHEVWGRILELIPANAIQIIPPPSGFSVSPAESAKGFGAYFLSTFDFWNLRLACCDEKYHPEKSEELNYLNYTLRSINDAKQKFMAINSCGDILVRKFKYADRYRFDY